MTAIKNIIRAILDFPTRVKNALVFRIHGVKCEGKVIAKGKIRVVNKGNISFGENAKILGGEKYNPIGFGGTVNIIAEKGSKITVGSGTGMSNCTLYSRSSITIGERVLLGAGVKIYDTDFHSLNAEHRLTSLDKQNTQNKPVVIENNAFIGAGTIVLKGVTIGEGAIVGAGSVVTKNISKGEIWAGNPAKKIR